MPDLMARARVDRPDVIGHGEVQDAVDQERRGFDHRILVGLKRPGRGESGNVLRSDLGERLCRRPE